MVKLNTRNAPFLAMILLLAFSAIGLSNHMVQAQSACSVQVSGTPTATSQSYSTYYGDWYVQMVVPISASCYYNGQLYAVGNVYDLMTNANAGYANIALNSGSGYYNTVLVFNLPNSVVEHELQVVVSVYNNGAYGGYGGYNGYGYYNGMMATTAFTVAIHGYQMNNNQNGYNNYPPSHYSYPPSYYNSQCYYDYQYGYMYYYYYNGNYYYANCYYGYP